LLKSTIKEQLQVPAKVDHLGDLRDFVSKVGKKHGYSERIINAFKLSIDEAATNIIKHAYRDWDGDIIIRSVIKKNSLIFILVDKGKYFDPRQVKEPDLKKYVDIGKKGGLGIFMMRRLLDKIDYRKTESGNELWLTKNRDESKRRKISVASIPLGLKARYWLTSMAVFSFLLLLDYLFFFFYQDNIVISQYIENGGKTCSVLAGDIATNLANSNDIDNEVIEELFKSGSQDIIVLNKAHTSLNTLLKSEYSDILHNALVVDNIQNILAIAEEDSFYKVLGNYEIPIDHKKLQDRVYLYHLKSGAEVVDLEWPVLDDENRKLCTIHFLIDYKKIKKDIASTRLNYFHLGLLVWVLGAAGLFLLIYLVMYPFRRLQEWVKALGQPGAAEELDIDTSTEVGAIAKAFSDITMKLRNSQVNIAEQERLQKEMQVAQEIQQTLLPSHFPELEGYDISSFYGAAKEVGGDYYDFVEVDNDTLGIVVADVSGKGVPGSLVMTMIRTALRTEARGVKDAAEVLTRVNDFVVNDMKKGMFVTLFYVIIDSKRRRINFASAGHNPMILCRTSKNKTYYLNPRGFPIGISLPDKELFKKSLQSDSIALAEDDILLVYTDGVTEAMNSKREMFGDERFLKVIRDHGKLKAEDFIEKLQKEIISFTEGSPQNDDITLVAIKEQTSADKFELKRAKEAFSLIQQGNNVKAACKKVGISTYSYYNKYKPRFDKEGIDSFVIETNEDELEVKHISVEDKTKIYDVIKRFPEYGAKRISEELNTEHYNFTHISHSRIYEELVQSKLNTKKLREAFVIKGAKKKRMKSPGTPLLTIDGQIIVDKPKIFKVEEREAEIQETVKTIIPPEEKEEQETIKGKIKQPETAEKIATGSPETSEESFKTAKSVREISEVTPEKREEIKEDEEESETSVDEIFLDSKKQISETKNIEEIVDIDTYAKFNIEEEFESITDVEKAIEELEAEEKQKKEEKTIELPEDKKELLTEIETKKEESEVPKEPEEEESELLEEESSEEKQMLIEKTEVTQSQPIGTKDAVIEEAETVENQGDILFNFTDFGFVGTDDSVTLSDDIAPVLDSDKPVLKDQDQDIDQIFYDFEVGKNIEIKRDDIKEEEVIDDLGLKNEKTRSQKIEQDEIELANMMNSGDSMIEIPSDSEQKEFDEANVEDIDIISESDMFEKDIKITEPFEEFIGLDDREKEIFLQEQDTPKEKQPVELVNEEFDFSIPFEEIWEIKEMKLIHGFTDTTNFLEQNKLSFEDLIDLVGGQKKKLKEGKETQLVKDKISEKPDVNKEKEKLFRDKLMTKAIKLYEKESYSDAIKIFQELLLKYPNDSILHGYLGNACFRNRNYQLAARAYEKVLELEPQNMQACENLGVVYANQGNLSKAIKQWEKLLEIDPERQDIHKSIMRAKRYLINN